MSNRWVEFLHNNEERFIVLDTNGLRAERPASTMIGIWYEGKVICKIFPDGIQHEVQILPPDSADVCARLTELLNLLGMPNLRVRWFGKCAYIQRLYKWDVVAKYALREPYTLKVTI